MATSPEELLSKLKILRNKLPAKAPGDLQTDYSAFLKKSDFFMVVLKRFADDGPSAKDQADFKAKKKEFTDTKKALDDLVTKINGALKEQENDKNDVITVLREVLKMQSDFQDKLKDSNDKSASDLSGAISKFSVGVQQASGLEVEEKVSD